MLTQAEADTRVAKGAAHLDQVRPGWFHRIDVGTLTLHDACGCIVGQLCQSGPFFSEGLHALQIPRQAQAHGLALQDFSGVQVYTDEESRREYGLLQDAWIAAIAQRRLPVPEDADILPEAVDAVAGTSQVTSGSPVRV